MNDQITIETTVTLPGGIRHITKVGVSHELYQRAEIPFLIEDTMSRVSRSLNQLLKESDEHHD